MRQQVDGEINTRGVPHAKVRGGAERSYPTLEPRGCGREGLPMHPRSGRAARGATPCPRIGGCTGTGGKRETYLTFKVMRGM